MDGPMKDIRVLDVSRVLAGPFCSMILGDLGADIVKVEPPEGDLTRSWGPPFLDGESCYYLSVNRNKRSICVDLSRQEGRDVLYDLVRASDVFLENFRPGVAQRLGIGYDRVKEVKRDIIYCSISGFGQDGPYRDTPSFDIILQALGGFMGITGEEGRPPVRIGVAIADLGAGLHAAIAVLAALWRWGRTGKGAYIDVSILDGQVFWLTYMAQQYFLTGTPPTRMGSRHPNIAPYQAFRTADGYIVVAAANEKFWNGMCRALEKEDLASMEDFSTNEMRIENREALDEHLEGIFRKRRTEDWLQRLQAEGVPCAPVNPLDRVFSDPQVLHRGMVKEVRHSSLGQIKQLGFPFKFPTWDFDIRFAPPLKGEHTREVLKEIGYGEDRIEKLRESRVVFGA
ncbi:MAG: CaiB/BaiF CoA transferase family protein [Thermoplasmata archaeon]